MKILGIQKDHNSAACLFYNNNLIYYNQEERVSRIKKDSGFPLETLKEICKICNEIDVLLISGYDHIDSENHSIIRLLQKIGFNLSSSFEFVPYIKSHHLSHAANAFYNSDFDSALVIVQDGKGSSYNLTNGNLAYETTSIFSVTNTNKFNLLYRRFFTNSKIEKNTKIVWDNNFPIDKIKKPNYLNKDTEIELRNDFDLGFMYEGTSRSIGFDDEGGKMLGLQSYGKYDSNLPQVLDDNLVFNMNVFKFDNFGRHLGFNLNDYLCLASKNEKINFAFMVQKAFENAGVTLIKKMLKKTGHKNIILTGGTALNVVANNFYRQQLDKDINMYIEPICGDEGNCIGLCQHYIHEKLKIKKINKPNSLYICGTEPNYNFSLKNNETILDDVDENLITDLIRSGNIVALFQGKAEAGPRALGNRSLLYDPRIKNGREYVNFIKGREDFRPFAASVLLQHATDWFNLTNIKESPYMMYAVDVFADKKEIIPAVTHVDTSCRIQTVSMEQNTNLYKIIESFYKKTKIPMLLNTSFNLSGDPIVETINDALESLRKSKLEYLYLPEIKKLIFIKN
jgi:carbamoyltransferase